jgi:cell division protein FtsI/penicillin-binding protein 2
VNEEKKAQSNQKANTQQSKENRQKVSKEKGRKVEKNSSYEEHKNKGKKQGSEKTIDKGQRSKNTTVKGQGNKQSAGENQGSRKPADKGQGSKKQSGQQEIKKGQMNKGKAKKSHPEDSFELKEDIKESSGYGKAIRIFMATFTCIVAITAAVTILYYLYTSYEKGPTPEQLVTEYFVLLEEGKYDQMYDFISDESKKAISKETFIARNKNIYSGIQASDIQVTLVETEDRISDKVLTYKTTMESIGGTIDFTNKVIVKKNSENLYKIGWDDHIIFPSLTSDSIVWVEDTQPIRGNIYDRNQNPIAEWGQAFTIGLIPGEVNETDDTATMEDSIAQLASVLKLSEEEVSEKVEKLYVDDETVIPIMDLTSSERDKINSKLLKIPGISIKDKEIRVYPYGEEMAHITGYIAAINAEEYEQMKDKGYSIDSIIGKSGLEKAYEERLKGEPGYEVVLKDKDKELIGVLASKSVQNGEDITVTIDAEMQTLLYEQFKKDKATAIAMDPLTGEVLAMVSTPSYDPNEFIKGISEESLTELTESEDKPFMNRFASTWAPGSTFKPITGAIGVTVGAIEPKKDEKSNGRKWQKDESWGEYFVTTLKEYGTVNLKNALVYSDNIYFAKAALAIGAEDFSKNLKKIGFNEVLPFDFTDIPMSTFGEDTIQDSETQLADSGYGQGKMLVSPLHLSVIYTALVNDGDMVKPYLEYVENPEREIWKDAVFESDAVKEVEEDIVQVVEKGTGSAAKISGIKIGGKTGTAEIKATVDDKEGTELGWFVAVTTDEESDKQLLVTAMVEDVKNRGGSGYVVPKVKEAFKTLKK